MTPTPGLVIADRFRLVRAIGEGKMGTVWRADHLTLDIPCAVKLIQDKAQQNEEARARFEREGKAAAQLRSPHVVQIFEYGVFDDTPYIAMELLEGESLEDRLERVGRLTGEQTFAILSQIGRALNKAHKGGVVHRDLKPANVFIVHDEDDGELVKVVDFGVAKEQGMGMTKSGMLMGTPAYMSPEQAVGSTAVDHRSDLWALGVLAFKCLTGQRPFAQKELVHVLMAIVKGPIPVPSASQAGLPPDFDGWWKKAVARAPEERFQSAKEQIEALEVALGLVHGTPATEEAPTERDPPPPLAGTMAMSPPPASTLLAQPHPAAPTPLAQQTPVTPAHPPAPRLEPLAPVVGERPAPNKTRTGIILGIAALAAVFGIVIGMSVMSSSSTDASGAASAAAPRQEPSAGQKTADRESNTQPTTTAAPSSPEPTPSPSISASTAVAPSPLPRAVPPPGPISTPPRPPPLSAPPPKPKDRIGF